MKFQNEPSRKYRENRIGPKFDSSIEKSEEAVSNLASFAEKILMDFKIETQQTKSNIIDELEKWQEKKLKNLAPAK